MNSYDEYQIRLGEPFYTNDEVELKEIAVEDAMDLEVDVYFDLQHC